MNHDPLIGQQLGNYLIQEPLGQGGMARVYKGLDIALKRPAAIKVINEGLRLTGSYAQRFEREAQAVAALRHPNIVSVFYFGNENGVYYLAMEFIDGTNLDAVMRNYETAGELMPHTDIIRILEPIAAALDYAHSKGVIHRDIKPSNIMLERDGRPILADFGLALRVSEGSVGDTFGTPHYISPEQARNSAAAVPQSDLYSLAAVMFELLTGSVPFDDPSATAIAMQHLTAPIPSPRAFNGSLSVEIEEVLFKALAKDPSERYESGAALIEALRTALVKLRQAPPPPLRELPPLPLGIEPPPPRRLSMQTVVDKVHQELAMQVAKGQSVTHMPLPPRIAPVPGARVYPGAEVPAAPKASKRPFVIGTLVGIVLVVLAGAAILSGGPRTVITSTDTPTLVAQVPSTEQPSETPVEPTLEPSSAPTLDITAEAASVTQEIAAPINTDQPAASSTPMIVLTPTSQLPPTLAPSSTPEPTITPNPTQTPPPAIQPTEVIPPTESIVEAAGPTAFPDDWRPVRFIHSDTAFYWLNDSQQSMAADKIIFEEVDGNRRFEGNRWSWFTLEPGRCMEIRFADVSAAERPGNCRPNAYYTPTRGQGVDFWTGDSGQFRVIWEGEVIAVCDRAVRRCDAALPPA